MTYFYYNLKTFCPMGSSKVTIWGLLFEPDKPIGFSISRERRES
jgi:hypothetical protein